MRRPVGLTASGGSRCICDLSGPVNLQAGRSPDFLRRASGAHQAPVWKLAKLGTVTYADGFVPPLVPAHRTRPIVGRGSLTSLPRAKADHPRLCDWRTHVS